MYTREHRPASDSVARIERVTHRYRGTTVLNNITLDLPAGCMVAFIGPDGVGKSTVLGLLAGVRKLQAGRVEVLGGDMRDRHHRAMLRRHISYMPEGLGKNLYLDLSVTENIDFFARLFGQSGAERERRIAELLESTGLRSFSGRYTRNLSGGMKQKLGLCCALIHDPDLLIFDEPTTGVDPLSRRQFWDLIQRIRERRPGISILVATAYMEEAEAFDWLVLMDRGFLLATGTPLELQQRTGTHELEDAYIGLLPQERRRRHRTFFSSPRAMRPEGAAIEAHELTRRFGKFIAVDHVSFHIQRGEIFGFLGPNGCGKTTTMKMLTGLLPATTGSYRLFGQDIAVGGMETRRRIGYMSQSFSLYTELTVDQNLELHGRLFHLPKNVLLPRLSDLIQEFGLAEYRHIRAGDLPVGIRQRLSLAVAVIHRPQMLILDEPTSGVDPIARDQFWEFLIKLSREEGVTIFVSTHFMNEGARCDRIALMNAGRVLACDSPSALIEERQAQNLEEAFVSYIELDSKQSSAPQTAAAQSPSNGWEILRRPTRRPRYLSALDEKFRLYVDFTRLYAYARRETLELSRDPFRLAFSLFAPLFLLIIFGYGISMDVEKIPYAVLDRDQTPASRKYLEHFTASRYFSERPRLRSAAELDRRLRSGDIQIAIEIPPLFGKDLTALRQPEIGIWIDGSNTFRAETIRGYISGLHRHYLADLSGANPADTPSNSAPIETRFRYNQDLESVFAIVPGLIALLLALIPAILTAVGVVREKEMGSIVNLYVTPVTRAEFLLGKQLPYVLISVVSFLTLVALTILLFGVPLKGSFAALAFGAVLFVMATTGFGLLLSAFTRSQIAALFAALILTMLPSMLFSGLLRPVSSLTGAGGVMGTLFPTGYFYRISVGTFTKALRFGDLTSDYLALVGFFIGFLLLSFFLLRKQET